LSMETEIIKVGFHRDGFQDIKDFSKEDYLLQSRGKECKEDSGMNGGKSEMEVYKVSFKELSERLAKRLRGRLITNQVEEISLRRQDLRMRGTDKKFRFDKLVNTVPYKIFSKLCGKEANCEIESVTFVKMRKDFFNMEGHSFIYFIDNYFYRLSDHGDYLVAEIRGGYDEVEMKRVYGDNFLDSVSLKTQVISEKVEPESKNIIFFGRYAEQDKSLKVENLIEKAKLYKQERAKS